MFDKSVVLLDQSFSTHDLQRVASLPIQVHRAFARQLKVNISWTALASQPILVGRIALHLSSESLRPEMKNVCRLHLLAGKQETHDLLLQVVLDTVEILFTDKEGMDSHPSRKGDETVPYFYQIGKLQFASLKMQSSMCCYLASPPAIKDVSPPVLEIFTLWSAGPSQDSQSSGWLGSITSLLLRTLFNVSIVVQNLVVKIPWTHRGGNTDVPLHTDAYRYG